MKKVCCVGQSVYDMTYPVYEDVVENKKYRITEKFECMGGPATNAAYLNAKWGNETCIISRVSDDLYGKKIIAGLREIGVNTEFMKICGQATSVSVIISNLSNGKRTIFNCPANKEDINFQYPNDVDVILVDGHELKASLEILDIFPNAKSIIDAGTYKPELKELISKVDYLICSEDFAKQYTNLEIHPNDRDSIALVFETLKKLNDKYIVVTIGERGLLYEKDGVINHIKAFECQPLDTTGAGDIFHGAFAYCLAKDYTLEKSLKISSMTSAISVETMGGQVSIPQLEKVIKRIEEL
ncbi:carbohydrate kinase family protein [Terrisporobacter petrolearius]|uniref:carbohydrate kinase family protein n=1 Tax=Terrisporobacter petrolearius TaxID=1460447 RepID=UPI0031CCC879